MIASKWSVPDSKILKRGEIATVLSELHRKASRSVNTRQTLVVFRLSCCCGLRVSEACGLRLRDVRVNVDRPYLRIPKSEAKGKKTKTVNGRKVKVGNGATARQIPLWWDQGTLDDLRAWKREREQQGASASDYFVCAQQDGTRGKRLDRRNARNRFIVACRALGSARAAEITIHHGRHSFISHALAGGRSLAEVAAAAGHANITITAIYTHVAVDDDGRIGSLFSFNPNGKRRPTTMSGRLPAYRGELQPLCGASVVRIQPYRSKLPAARSLTRTSDRSRGIKSETTKPWASGT